MKILIVDDDGLVRRFLSDAMTDAGHQVLLAASGDEALQLAFRYEPGLIFCDVVMEGMSGFQVLRALRESGDETSEFVLMTGQPSVEDAARAVQMGATDYLTKPLSIQILRALATASESRRSPSKAVSINGGSTGEPGFIGNSPVMIEVVKAATRIAATELAVMISGESGTGKELVARLIHERSARKNREFVAVNCGALPDTLLEAELFGHSRGAFTGAYAERRGLFEEADGGTLLLDEVTETSPAFQVKLLRVLQEGEIRPLGSNAKRKVDVRVLAATNRDPMALVDKNCFRQDLLFRLRGVQITLPPLRHRRPDVLPMAHAFLGAAAAGRTLLLTDQAAKALEQYDWPGNVRELKHVCERVATLSRGTIDISDLPTELTSTDDAPTHSKMIPEGNLPTLEELEASYLTRVLGAVGGNKSLAAQVMGVDRKTLYRMLERGRSVGKAAAGQSMAEGGRA